MALEVWGFTGTPVQRQALAACAAAWQGGPQPFWSLEETSAMLERESCSLYFAATSVGSAEWAGAAMIETTSDMRDLLYLFVPAAQRRAGVGQLLLRYLLNEGPALILEVRPSNTAAMALYQRHGFAQVGRRRAYYANGEDALVLKHPGLEPA